jgi:hypothetical protein
MQINKVDDKALSLSDNSFQDWYLKQPLYAYAKHTLIVAALSFMVHGTSAKAQTDNATASNVTGVLSESVRLAYSIIPKYPKPMPAFVRPFTGWVLVVPNVAHRSI